MSTSTPFSRKQNLDALEAAWALAIASFAREAVREMKPLHATDDHVKGFWPETLQLDAAEIVSARLLDSEQWAEVKATDISDIAYEAVGKIIAAS